METPIRPLMQNVIYAGAAHVKPGKPLPAVTILLFKATLILLRTTSIQSQQKRNRNA